MKLIFGPANALVYALMELAAITIAGIVWAFWNLISPEKQEEEEEEPSVRIKLVGKDLFKYKDDRVERLGPMWEAKRWMERLMTKEDWNECMAAIERKDRERTIEKLRRQIDYREAQKAEVELRSNFAADTYELVTRYADGMVKVQQIDPMEIFEYGGIGKYMQDLERQLEIELKRNL